MRRVRPGPTTAAIRGRRGWRRSSALWWWGVLSLWLAAGSVWAQEEDEIIIIEEDEEERIIIEDGEAAPGTSESVQVTGALGRLWESWYLAADADMGGQVQFVAPEDGSWRMRAGLRVETRLLPAPNLSFLANGFARVFLDGLDTSLRVTPVLDFYEAYAQVNLGAGAVQLGRLVVPWAKTGAAALGDRLNPPDYRRGRIFVDPVRGRQPQYGALVRTSLGALTVEGVLFTLYEPSEGSLAAANQGGFRVGRYQTALVRAPARASGLGADYDRSGLWAGDRALEDVTTFALRVRRRLGDFDLGGSVVWGNDETPRLALRPEMALFLARDSQAQVGGGLGSEAPCDVAARGRSACFGGPGTLTNTQTTSVSADVVWGLGVVILKAEAMLYPTWFGGPGKTTWIIDDEAGVSSTQLQHFGATVAAEGAIGDWLNGSVELFDLVWDGVPPGALVWPVEPSDVARGEARTVHRPAVAANLSGAGSEQRLTWKLRGEIGLSPLDVLAAGEVRYRLPVFDLYVGAEARLFAGPPGSPGWFRQDASLVGIFVGEGN